MVLSEVREFIANINPEVVVFDNPSFDRSIIGIDASGHVIYDLEKMVEELAEEDDITEEEARDFIDYNTLRSLSYIDYAPIILACRTEDFV